MTTKFEIGDLLLIHNNGFDKVKNRGSWPKEYLGHCAILEKLLEPDILQVKLLYPVSFRDHTSFQVPSIGFYCFKDVKNIEWLKYLAGCNEE